MTLNLMEYKRNNWTLIICVVAVVLVIIFIPDFLGLDSFFDDGENQQEVTEQVVGEQTSKPKKKTKSEKHVSQVANESTENMAYFSSFDDATTNQDIQPISRPELTWEQLKTPTYQQILTNARRTASQLSATVSETYENSRYALFNFVTGVDYVMQKAPSRMSVNEAMNLLEHLDMEVTRNFVKDGLERSYFDEWQKVSLTNLVGTNRSDRFKKMSMPRFRPEVTLGTVGIKVQKSNRTAKRSRQDVYDASKMDIDFSIKADGAVKGEIYRDSKKIRDINLNNRQNTDCKRGVCPATGTNIVRTEMKGLAVDGIYTVRLYDRDNKIYDKQYSFTKAFRLPNWRIPANQQNQIVFSMPATLTSSRAEGIFALHNDYEDGFITSGDDAGFYNY